MRSLIAAAIISLFFSIQAFADDNTFVPTTPNISITSGEESGLVSLTPTFSGSEVSGADLDFPNATYTLQASEWLVYETIDPSVKLLGGFEAHTNNLTYSATTFEERDFPYSVTIDGTAVERIRIYGAPKIELLTSTGEILAEVSIIPDFTDYVTHQPNHQALVLSKEFDDSVVYSWHMKNSTTSPNSWVSTFQAIIRLDGKVGGRSSINNLNDSFFDINNYQAVGCRLRNNGNLLFLMGTPAGWKSTLTNEMQDTFSFVCSQGINEILLSTFSSAEPSEISMPNFVIQSTSASVDYAVSEAETLIPNTNYTALARYSASSDSNVGTNYSFWSAPISFTTADNISSEAEFHIGITEDPDKPFIEGQLGAITINVYNVGPTTGSPSFFVRFPFDITSATGESYGISSLNQDQYCEMEIIDSNTVFTCQIINLQPGDSSTAEITVSLSASQGQFEYAVCYTESCENPEYIQTNVNVLLPETNSSSGGALTLLLLAAPFLRRRKIS
jgi:MYXO-CTERM domain-containing protein